MANKGQNGGILRGGFQKKKRNTKEKRRKAEVLFDTRAEKKGDV